MAGKKVVYGVFDWGLGHATRSKPLIEELLKKNCKVDIITTGRALKVLQGHFGKNINEYHDLPSIASPYTDSKHFCLSFIMKSPEMLNSLRKARKLSEKIIDGNDYDLIISDCRYDVYGKKKKSFLINHQLRFKAPAGGETAVEAWLAYRMSRFNRVLVPDYPGKNNLSGKLSHKLLFLANKKIAYLGHISHVQRKDVPKDIDYFIMITGPEPQRSILEKKVLKQCSDLKGRIVIAGGNPDSQHTMDDSNVEYHSYLPGEKVEDCLNRSKFVVTRSGFTSMMELAELGIKKALLIPTPGQTEQEYLAKLYEKKGYYHHVDQERLNLAKDIETARGFEGFTPEWDCAQSIKNFLKAIEL
jgi:uncharacterized protein (TIGR00661 family)